MSKPQTSMPWINGDLKKEIRRNNRLFKSRKKSQKHRSNFLKNRRNLQKQMRQARWDHINGIITQEGDKARKGFWRYVKQFKKDNTGITVLKKDGRSATSPQRKAEMLNVQFSSVFTEEDTENLPQLNKQYPSLSILNVSAIGVEKLLLNLNARSKGVQPTRGWTVAAQRSTNCTHSSCPPQWGPVSTVFWTGRPSGPAGWLALLLLKAGDAETNPGPKHTRTQVWICDICHREITRKQTSLRCNHSEHWVHLRCAHIRVDQYRHMDMPST